MSRIQLKNEIREISRIRNITPPRLNGTNANFINWININWININRLNSNRVARTIAEELAEVVTRRKTRITRKENIESKIRNKQFNELFKAVLREDGERYSEQEANNIVGAMIANSEIKYIFTINNTDFPLTRTTDEITKKILMDGQVIEEIPDQGSDRIYDAIVNGINTIDIVAYPINRTRPDQDGAYFPRLNSLDKHGSKSSEYVNLERYQIFPKSKDSENCLIHTLSLMPEISATQINQIKLALTAGASIAKKNLKTISEILKMTIILHHMEEQHRVQKFGKFENEINIALYMNHYFIYEETKYTNYSIKNYNNIKHRKNWWNLYKKNDSSTTKSKISSLQLIHLMNELKYFIVGDMSNACEAAEHIDLRDRIFLDNIHNEQRPIGETEIKTNTTDIYYADFETFTGEEIHKMFLLGCVSRKTDEVKIWNVKNYTSPQYMIYDFLKMLTSNGTKDATCYFHNLKYDYNIMEKYLNISSICKKDNRLYRSICYYKNKKIEFKDSCKLAAMELAQFQKNFNLDEKFNKLDAINYNYYTPENNNKLSTRAIYSRGLTENQKKTLYDTVKTENFNPTSYYIEYLKMDCLVLKKGLEKFNDLILSIDPRLSVHTSLTISSLTDTYMLINGAYTGVYENTANLRDFVGKAIYGGRVHVNEKYIKKTIEEKIADYDGVSLYPSAIDRLCKELDGLPMGSAKRWSAEFPITDIVYAIYSIKITAVNKKQQMPFIAVKSTDSLDYVNTPPLGIIQIDSTTLEDYVRFHEIEYEILDGVYWNEGSNNKMGDLINILFNLRVENKESNPALANILKLMLNSAYGKTMTTKSTAKTEIVKKDKNTLNEDKEWVTEENKAYEDFIYKNFNTLKSSRKINNRMYEVERTTIDISHNRGHIGCAILSMSKRIMNEVFDICNDNNIRTFYQDTDSMHLPYDDVPKLEKAFHEKYNRNLTGSQLGQFHNDFELKGVHKVDGISRVYSTKSIFLGKKSYIDSLEGLDKDGNLLKGHHIRLKGITKESIAFHGGDKPFEMFKKLSEGTEMEMTLNPRNTDGTNDKPMFEYVEGGVRIRKAGSFKRTIKF